MSYYGIDIYDYDYLQGGAQAAEQTAQQAAANVGTIGATGTTAQIIGFDAGGNPSPKNVAGDANGAGLAFSGDTLTATLPQNLQSTGSPTFSSLNIINQGTFGDLKIGGGPVIKNTATGTLSLDPGSLSASSRGSVDATLTGVAIGDIVILQPPNALDTGLVYGGCEVSATDTLKVFLANLTTSAVNDGPNDWRYLWLDLT
jgi:hypothetical protein